MKCFLKKYLLYLLRQIITSDLNEPYTTIKMNTESENVCVTSRERKYNHVLRKRHIKLNSIYKFYRRKNKTDRLLITANSIIIMSKPYQQDEEQECDINAECTKRISMRRARRKPSHRPKSEQTIFDFDTTNVQFVKDEALVEPVAIEMETIMEKAEKLLGSKQDYPFAFTDGKCDTFGTFDGHGRSDLYIDEVRKLKLPEHFAKENPFDSIEKEISASIFAQAGSNIYQRARLSNQYKNSGSTMTFCRTRVEGKKVHINTAFVGDSPFYVFINGILQEQIPLHKPSNKEEVQHMIAKGYIDYIKPNSSGFKLLSDTEVAREPGKYASFSGEILLGMTRAMGHETLTSKEPTERTYTADETDEIKVIVVSDGVSDMLNLDFPGDLEKLRNSVSAQEVVDFAERRWKQNWTLEGSVITFPDNGMDDISCAFWHRRPVRK